MMNFFTVNCVDRAKKKIDNISGLQKKQPYINNTHTQLIVL